MVFQFEIMDIDAGGQGHARSVRQHGGVGGGHAASTVQGGAEAVNPLEWKERKLLELKNVTEKWQVVKREEGFWNA